MIAGIATLDVTWWFKATAPARADAAGIGPRTREKQLTQLDLFRDGRATQAANALRWALRKREAGKARRAHGKLAAAEPLHRWLKPADKLIAALDVGDPAESGDALAMLGLLEGEWMEAAAAVLAEDAEHFLAPLWRTVATALEGQTFDLAHPKRHASWAWMRAGDWEEAHRSIGAVPNYRDHPVLLGRIAEAAWRLQGAFEARGHWFGLCWLAPEAFERLIGDGGIPDPELRHGWETCRDLDVEPEISAAWFPAWLLVHRPGWSRMLSTAPGDSAPETAYNTVRALARGCGPVVAQRARPKRLHPGLLELLLERQ